MDTANVVAQFEREPSKRSQTERDAIEALALSRLRIALREEQLRLYEEARKQNIVPTEKDVTVTVEMQRAARAEAAEFVNKRFPDYAVSLVVVVTSG